MLGNNNCEIANSWLALGLLECNRLERVFACASAPALAARACSSSNVDGG